MPKPPKGQTLTAQQEEFCQEYAVCYNQTLAAINAHYSKRSAAEIGYENIENLRFEPELRSFLKEKVMSREEVLARLAEQDRSTLYPFVRVDKDGFVYFNFADPEALKHLHLIKKIKSKRNRQVTAETKKKAAEIWEGEWVEVELHDPQKALELIGKHHSLFIDRDEKGNPIQPIVNVYMPNNGRDQNGDAG